ncbi:MAG: ABC transporter permease subunit [Lysinibacillus sp.]
MIQLINLEMKQLIRSKWLQIVTVLFVVTFTAVLLIQQLAMPNVEGFTRQSAALLNVLLFLLPLFMLTIGAMSIASDIESGWLNLLRSYPLSTGAYVMTKWLGLFVVFFAITFLAVMVAIGIGALFGGIEIPLSLILLVLCMLLIFTAIATFTGSLSKNRLHALAIGLGVWSLISLVVSYVLMAIGTLISENLLKALIVLNMHLNPLEWLRFSYFLFTKQTAVLGPEFYELVKFYDSGIGYFYYILITLLWITLPLLLAAFTLKKRGERA